MVASEPIDDGNGSRVDDSNQARHNSEIDHGDGRRRLRNGFPKHQSLLAHPHSITSLPFHSSAYTHQRSDYIDHGDETVREQRESGGLPRRQTVEVKIRTALQRPLRAREGEGEKEEVGTANAEKKLREERGAPLAGGRRGLASAVSGCSNRLLPSVVGHGASGCFAGGL
ncbi:hypothetical protein Nepgr_028334 [Nepenthes gracilis]|uniref:Uncharacterized protein n=1 Tax=Nepenthes gracilis TaxID=150966 RepID=A0AAD3Y4F3_NEPGR|nr:hypothetical protein Nepgr_028334 [Nepenthes gracilis]